ncbi:hypothetical protein I307_01823 [Cryptococcus deuterogattii 99/473]|uniref:Uncharacterized protein n=1 Tax=Cryptococcus deuterogattii Ram5 TaxID=1296110 RepID=A0A0D0UY55_9TREE|nr:hypothetical protein I309_02450 [Cryptococcus deuterogattii LA55]KIR35318.1 hypothetical protein I352_02589 [Cryptococcus deuterogattii MMRL2647]KIR40271.1 hypothetical protein I313_03593 [Cryptococcus deuterogattii Ram5]KIR71982.1 hypothetical protein I310_04032 [Cryptococcus deuterogattii CA1014]KIR93545.1 hypothetical protein I304_02217 [Cryptococcus deuterogattii CBS 10090]KIR99812.1 hypothetical protein L804_02446 [Cryptococcus deuterogattii 2001/935-1]KIY58512.1 hypothetical protein 
MATYIPPEEQDQIDLAWMREALIMAEEALSNDEVPVGLRLMTAWNHGTMRRKLMRRFVRPRLDSHPAYVAVGGFYREEAIMLLRRFYMSQNPNAPKPKKKATRVLKTDIPPPPSRNTTPQSSRPSSTAPSQRWPVPSADASTTGTSTPTLSEGENKSQERLMRDDGLPIGSTMVSTPSETPLPQEGR